MTTFAILAARAIGTVTGGDATTPAGGGGGGGLGDMLPTLLLVAAMVGVFYFLIIRPQKKRDKEAKDMRSSVKVGDDVVTIGGVCGRVVNVKDDRITILSGESKMAFLKTAIASVTSPEEELEQ